MKRPEQEVETFSDGVVEVYAESGRKLGDRKIKFGFEQKSVGVNRFYQSQESIATSRIDRVIKVPHTNKVDTLDIAVIVSENNRQYKILRIQNKPEKNVDYWELESVRVAIGGRNESVSP